MASAVTLRAIGDWRSQVGIPLQSALAVAMDVFGYEGEKACRQCLYFMAQSAGKLTRISRRERPVNPNRRFAHLLRKPQYKQMRMAGKDMKRYYHFTAKKLQQHGNPPKDIYANREAPLRKIGYVGLASKSWLWSHRPTSKMIRGVVQTFTIHGSGQATSGWLSEQAPGFSGYVLVNRLSYINQAMPSGWEADVERRATNRIMGRARDTIARRWTNEMSRKGVKTVKTLASYFLGAMR